MDKIIVDHVSKEFATRGKGSPIRALEDINALIKEDEFTIFIGQSGCGKTTLLNIIAGLVRPTKGRVLLDGKEVKGPGADRGYVFQQFALFPWMTVSQNIEYGPKLRHIPENSRREILDKYLNLVDLSEFRNAYPRELSGGMKQRVAIARAYANEPLVLLMDEPFGSLDAQTRSAMQEELVKIWKKARITIVFVTHSVEEAVFLADRIFVFTPRPGRIREVINITEDSLLPLEGRYKHEIKRSPEFIDLREDIWEKVLAR